MYIIITENLMIILTFELAYLVSSLEFDVCVCVLNEEKKLQKVLLFIYLFIPSLFTS